MADAGRFDAILSAHCAAVAPWQEIGGDIVWFDKSDLESFDDFREAIQMAISECFLFLSLISQASEKTIEGLFRREWLWAGERANNMAGSEPFIIPVIVDLDYEGDVGTYKLVPEAFRRFHFGHAPEGHLTPGLRRDLIDLISRAQQRRHR